MVDFDGIMPITDRTQQSVDRCQLDCDTLSQGHEPTRDLGRLSSTRLPSYQDSLRGYIGRWTPANGYVLQGRFLQDPFLFLEDTDNPRTQTLQEKWARTGDAFFKAIPQRGSLIRRMTELRAQPVIEPPTKRADRYFFRRQLPNREQKVLMVRDGLHGDDHILFDPNQFQGGTGKIDQWSVSPNGAKLAFAYSPQSNDFGSYYVLDVEQAKSAGPGQLPLLSDQTSPVMVTRAPEWLPDGRGFFYRHYPHPEWSRDRRVAHAEVLFHELGTHSRDDEVIYPATGSAEIFASPAMSPTGRYLFIEVWRGYGENDIYYRDLQNFNKGPQLLFSQKGVWSSVRHHQGYFYIMTTKGSGNKQILRRAVDSDAWNIVVPERLFNNPKDPSDGVIIQDFQIVNDRLVLRVSKKAVSSLEFYTLDGARLPDLPALDGFNVKGFSGEPDHTGIVVEIESFLRPRSLYVADPKHGRVEEWEQVDLPFSPKNFEVNQVWYPSRDGTLISMFLVHKKGLKHDANNPVFLYGYGGFNVSKGVPHFREMMVPWLEAGGIFAVPALRGGGEYGEAWHQAGMMEKKQNVFDDFIGAAEYLIQNNYTRPERMGIFGGSNGALLTASVMAQRPELFGAVIIHVPLFDLERYTQIAAGRTWVGELGDPTDNAQPEIFNAIHAYSPYRLILQNGPRHYPAVMVTAGAADGRTGRAHPLKAIAVLHKNQQGGAAPVFRLDRESGHSGPGKLTPRIALDADLVAFMMHALHVSYED
jgi:prolyl oligopeptidase